MGKEAYVYFMANITNNVLYVGVTNNLERRVSGHKNLISKQFHRKIQMSQTGVL